MSYLLSAGSPAISADQTATSGVRDWPAITREARPWTRWWWQGSAVDRAGLGAEMATLAAAGIGGVEITPIYGVRGAEARFVPYLSPEWVALLEHTLDEARRRDIGVDMATGTGWPFGGPWVGDDIAARSIVFKTWTIAGGTRLGEPVRLRQMPLVRALGNQIHVVNEGAPGDPPRTAAPAQPVLRSGTRPLEITDLADPLGANKDLQALALEQVKYPHDLPLTVVMAYGDSGTAVDLTSRVGRDGTLDWTAPAGRWTVYAGFLGWHGKLVERAAPGGEGYVIDHFSAEAIRGYLAAFDRAFAGRRPNGLRAFFNDSYEVDDATGQADWTPAFFAEFEKRRGYDLRRHLPALAGRDSDVRNVRVLADYRETVSDLLLDTFTAGWRAWAHGRQQLVRNQAHGSPASLLDLYAASDIPETEGTEIPRFKWATSAAHVAGRRLVSAETATWLGEHFRSTLADVRQAIDRAFVAGVNHIVYHGTAYSPAADPWPGWQFYAAVEFNARNAWWDDFGALNRYVARVQSFLQAGAPDHDVLLYFPFYDALAMPGAGLLTHFGGAAACGDGRSPCTPSGAPGTAFDEAADTLQRAGFTYDFISDRQLGQTRVDGDQLVTSGGSYRVVVLPSSRFIPLDTFQQVLALARGGATVLSFKSWPADVSGLADVEARRARLRQLTAGVVFGPRDAEGIAEARLGRGRILRGHDLPRLLARAGIARERLVDQGLQFVRRRDTQGRVYFIHNPGERAVDGWVPVETAAPAITLFDPMDGRRGRATTRQSTSGTTDVYVQLPPAGSLIIAAASAAARATAPPRESDRFDYYRPTGAPVSVAGPWNVRFVKGGPALPAPRTIQQLASWTSAGGDDVRSFSGTATYTTTFARPAGAGEKWQLDLGEVHESARVRLNGRDLGTLIGAPYRLVLDRATLLPSNTLEISVTNLSANRVADLDRKGVVWKKFYNVNYPARLPQNRGADGLFTAAAWEPLESGLVGPVTLTPLAVVGPAASAAPLQTIPLATGSGVTTLPEPRTPFFDITKYGAVSGGPALANQKAINDAIAAAAAAGGGTVVVPAGVFKTYTIRLKSRVGLHLAARDSILRAAVQGAGVGQDGGFYDAPEPNLFVGLQDHGHSHWANSLIYGVDVEDVMISGPGLIDGSYRNERGEAVNVLSGADPREVSTRTDAGEPGGGNKAIALKNARRIVFRDFSLLNGGHFGIIGTGVVGWTVDGVIVDTNRDAFNIDASQNVTVRNSVFNSLTDDAIVLKASFGLGKFMPTQNVLIERCTVSGYDAGSVIDKVYSTQKLVATDRDGPTARIKLGTEGTTGFNTITIRNVTFDRSRGFALESVDGAELRDVVMTDVTMKNVSSSPIFIRLGDRGRTPVTGKTTSELVSPANSVRLDDRGWVLPDLADRYGRHPAVRYVPSYDKSAPIRIGGASTQFTIVNPAAPTLLNADAVNSASPLFANAVGAGFARVRNISISRVTIEDADPRYPILIAGLVDHPIENVQISDVSVQYRGGLKMEHAVEQRQLNQQYSYTAYPAGPASQSVPWLVNTFFSKNEALLPRVGWDAAANAGAGAWVPDPYNIPEMPREYPEPSNFGVLPAYGMYARHVRGLTVTNVTFAVMVEDERPAVVLDDVDTATFSGFIAATRPGVPVFVKVTNTKKREAGREYVLNHPFTTTTVRSITTPAGLAVQDVLVDRPAPGTPPDNLYALPTAPSATQPFSYAVADAAYPKPVTVIRPFFDVPVVPAARIGQALTVVVNARSLIEGAILRYSTGPLPAGARFDPATRTLTWTPRAGQVGAHTIRFIADDGVFPVHRDVVFTVADPR